jgi:hypothetical protein
VARSNQQNQDWLDPEFPRGDAREVFARISSATPLPQGAADTFVASKLRLLRAHPLPSSERERQTTDFVTRMQIAPQVLKSLPGGGGVGYGMFYDQNFRVAFQTGTGIAWGIVFSIPPGGNVSNWLFLTAMNRASLGCEAFIAYNGQTDISFNVFDWAIPKWQVHTPISQIPQYIGSVTASGNRFPMVQVANLTYQADGLWVNDVRVLNQNTNTLDSAYRNQYPATLPQQIGSFMGSWAPIVETFQAEYAGTNPMGCDNAKFAMTDSDGAWAPWSLLTPAEAMPRSDENGFTPVGDPTTYSWAVTS